MKRTVAFCFVLLFIANSCQLPAERVPVRMLPEDSPPLPYAELLTRARLQSSSATEAFYVDQWADVEEAARGLSQTARFMNKAIEVPDARKKTLTTDAEELQKAAIKLTAAAKAKDAKECNVALQQITLSVRKLKLAD
jgi:hypothetical protein